MNTFNQQPAGLGGIVQRASSSKPLAAGGGAPAPRRTSERDGERNPDLFRSQHPRCDLNK